METGKDKTRVLLRLRKGIVALCLGSLLGLDLWAPALLHATADMANVWRDFYYDFGYDNLLYTEFACALCHDIGGGTDFKILNPYGQDLNQYRPAALNLKDPRDSNGDGTPDSWEIFTDYLLWIEVNDPDGDLCTSYEEINTSYVVQSHPGAYNPFTCSLDDTDEDGIPDVQDICPFHWNPDLPQADMDKDRIGDDCDADVDGDGFEGVRGDKSDCDDFTYSINPAAREICGNSVDENCDGVPTPASLDTDGDGVVDCNDNCVYFVNPNQWDQDRDGVGDECDPTRCGNDPDGDCMDSSFDNCPMFYNPAQFDQDSDGMGDFCDCDADGDGFDTADVKRDMYNQVLCNGSGIDCADYNRMIGPGRIEDCRNYYDDNCDGYMCPVGSRDPDFDGIPWDYDNCPMVFNVGQEDRDGDGVGDHCTDCGEDCDRDGLVNSSDPAPHVVPDGDVNRDGTVDLADLMLAEQIASGAVAADGLHRHMADVAPYVLSGGVPDGRVDLQDVGNISRMIGQGN